MTPPPTVHLVCGSTGAGKTTYAMTLAEETGALRFSIDEWMVALFWMDSPEPIVFDWTIERVRRCETQIWDTVRQAAARGLSSVLDLGLGRREHREAFYDKAAEAGLRVRLHWLDVDASERWARVERRNAERGATFRLPVTREMFDFIDGSLWEPPTEGEMADYNGVRMGGPGYS